MRHTHSAHTYAYMWVHTLHVHSRIWIVAGWWWFILCIGQATLVGGFEQPAREEGEGIKGALLAGQASKQE